MPDPYFRSWGRFVHWLIEAAPSERAFLEWCYLWIYTPRAHNDGTVAQIIEEVLAFPHKQRTEDLQHFLGAFFSHDTTDRLPAIAAPTLVLAGGRDLTSRPELCRAVAELIPGARFEVMEEEAHQPFQEVPDQWERPRRHLLAPARGAGLSPPGSIANGAMGHRSTDKSAGRTRGGWPVRVPDRAKHAVLQAQA